jgi:hypothetical protein
MQIERRRRERPGVRDRVEVPELPQFHRRLISHHDPIRSKITLPDRDLPHMMAPMTPLPLPITAGITLRAARPDDLPAIHDLAALDSSPPPAGPLLLAFESDTLRAALSLSTGASIADPFSPTSHLLPLLHRAASRRTAPPRWSTRPGLPRLALRAS